MDGRGHLVAGGPVQRPRSTAALPRTGGSGCFRHAEASARPPEPRYARPFLAGHDRGPCARYPRACRAATTSSCSGISAVGADRRHGAAEPRRSDDPRAMGVQARSQFAHHHSNAPGGDRRGVQPVGLHCTCPSSDRPDGAGREYRGRRACSWISVGQCIRHGLPPSDGYDSGPISGGVITGTICRFRNNERLNCSIAKYFCFNYFD